MILTIFGMVGVGLVGFVCGVIFHATITKDITNALTSVEAAIQKALTAVGKV